MPVFVHAFAGTWSKLALSPATPQRELREAEEDGIERKDGMHNAKQSSRCNETIVSMTDQRTCVRLQHS